MARAMDVFIASKESLEEIVRELEALLKITPQQFSDEYEIWYEFQDEHTLYLVDKHEYVNDRGITFEDYQYDIEIVSLNIKDIDAKAKHLEDTAYRVFNLLKQTKKYPLMLVDNLQIKLDEFHP